MARLPGWMPILLDRIQWGCSTSPWFVNLADESKIDEMGKRICLELWPFIRELPTNIAFVRDAIPENVENLQAARNLLGQLSDDERHYQELFLKQCYFAGLTEEELCSATPTVEAEELCEAMRRMCRDSDYVDGVHAIVAAEFAATLYSRSALPIYENHFQNRPDHNKERTDVGLEWIRLHAKTHTRHAIWMTRMLGDIEDSSGNDVPRAADLLLNCLLKLWQCPPEEQKQQVAATVS
jgi:pyrroloquinoline quinone (PQQ) biosynthesis protein C